jgi:hypothetical protein
VKEGRHARICDKYFYNRLFNNILNTRHFPELWVQSIIIPVFKKGNINEPKTYRGISLVDLSKALV